MAARKTIDVVAVKDRCNTMIDVQTSPDARRAAGMLCESVLLATGNYKGFRYLPEQLNPDGSLKDGYDDTKRYYL
jgi:hypothetical protein